jgi:hypothetical protein
MIFELKAKAIIAAIPPDKITTPISDSVMFKFFMTTGIRTAQQPTNKPLAKNTADTDILDRNTSWMG